MIISGRAQQASRVRETLCQFRSAAIQADTPRMTIRLSGEMRAQTILEARKKTVSMQVLQSLYGK